MSRQFVDKEFLLEYIESEFGNNPDCDGCKINTIIDIDEDEDGANWTPGRLVCDEGSIGMCSDHAISVLTRAKQVYSLKGNEHLDADRIVSKDTGTLERNVITIDIKYLFDDVVPISVDVSNDKTRAVVAVNLSYDEPLPEIYIFDQKSNKHFSVGSSVLYDTSIEKAFWAENEKDIIVKESEGCYSAIYIDSEINDSIGMGTPKITKFIEARERIVNSL